MVWSAGLAPVKFLEDCGLPLKRGRIEVDEYLRVPGTQGRILAIGDNAIINKEEKVLPPTASVAEQQGYYISDCFNNYYDQFDITRTDNINKDVPLPGNVVPALLPWEGKVFEFLNRFLSKHSPKFEYKNRGSMAVMGECKLMIHNNATARNIPPMNETTFQQLTMPCFHLFLSIKVLVAVWWIIPIVTYRYLKSPRPCRDSPPLLCGDRPIGRNKLVIPTKF